ncbi:hypothetical protein chiPu_0020722 [Chiloscyllium punctatum]|uniref:Uncharacterized protein n=1 Tax=Chiloscyllium punctatum TaxID=137246 RepID=A0A401RIW7_CHIPU|nr:hypothetical protein [Chiloscyllium punctatum]
MRVCSSASIPGALIQSVSDKLNFDWFKNSLPTDSRADAIIVEYMSTLLAGIPVSSFWRNVKIARPAAAPRGHVSPGSLHIGRNAHGVSAAATAA